MDYKTKGERRRNYSTVPHTTPQNGESFLRVVALGTEALDEGVPHEGVSDFQVSVHEFFCLFEIVGFEECPCEEGEGSGVGGGVVGLQLREEVGY